MSTPTDLSGQSVDFLKGSAATVYATLTTLESILERGVSAEEALRRVVLVLSQVHDEFADELKGRENV